MSSRKQENLAAQEAWNTNAKFWNEKMADGNQFFKVLLWPGIEQLLQVQPGERILDVACGNGLTSRLLVRAGARVTAFDFSTELIGLAREWAGSTEIDYRVVDATNEVSLLELGSGTFDGALSNMGLMDMAEIEPLMKALASLLRTNGRFVFSVMHPSFNNPSIVQMGEMEDRSGELVTTYSVKIPRYLTPFTQLGLAFGDQSVPHPYFHRPLHALLAPAFASGFVLDGLEERAYPPGYSGTTALSWGSQFGEIPPVLVVRLRRL
jgi:SAM-dependent methyltransferase